MSYKQLIRHPKQCIITGVEGKETEGNEMQIIENPILSVIHESIERVDARTLFYFLRFQKVRQLRETRSYIPE